MQTHMSIGDSNTGMGFDHPVTSKVLLGPGELGRRQTLLAAGLHIVGAGRVRLHSHTESAFLHTESAQQRNLYSWNPNS